MLPDRLGSRKLTDCKTNGELIRLAEDRNGAGVILMPLIGDETRARVAEKSGRNRKVRSGKMRNDRMYPHRR